MSYHLRAIAVATTLAMSWSQAQAQPVPPPAADEAQPPQQSEPTRTSATIAREIADQDQRSLAAGLASPSATQQGGHGLFWAALQLPERLLEATFLPFAAIIVVTERYELAKRVADLLSNEAETIVASPKFKISTGQGLGVGSSIKFQSRLASRAQLRAAGLVELDGDFEVGVEYSHRVASLEGRRVSAAAEFERERGSDFFGIGAGTASTDKRELGVDELRVDADIELNSHASEPAQLRYGSARFGFLRQRLFAGQGSAAPLGDPNDSTIAPARFGETRNYAILGVSGNLDSRDTEGRTSRGYLVELDAHLTSDIGDRSSTAATGKLTAGLFIPIAGRNRTLVVSLGLGVAESLTDTGEIPLNAYLTLGRNNHLSGYGKDRFRATRAWWSRLEYRYPVWYLKKYPVVLTSRLFVDFGREGTALEEVLQGPVRYSIGGGFSAELFQERLSGIQLAGSPEGFQFVFTAGTAL